MIMEFSAQQIAALLGGKLIGNANAMVRDVAPIEQAQPHHLSFITEEKYLPCLETTKAGVVLITKDLKDSKDFGDPKDRAIILVENARGAMGQLLGLVSKAMNPPRQGMEQPCFVSEGVEVPSDAYVGALAYIGKNVRLGKGVQIYPHVFIGDNVTIGDGTVLYAGVRVYAHCVIGKHCILHAGVVIGADGFGFEPDAQGVNQKIPQIGNVIILFVLKSVQIYKQYRFKQIISALFVPFMFSTLFNKKAATMLRQALQFVAVPLSINYSSSTKNTAT